MSELLQVIVLCGDAILGPRPLGDDPLTLGADPDADLVLPGPADAETTGEIRRGARGGFRLFTERGTRTRKLKAGEAVALGPHTLLLLPASGSPGGRDLVGPVLDLANDLWSEAPDAAPHATLLRTFLEVLDATWGAVVLAGDPESPEVLVTAGTRPAGAGEVVSRTVLRELARRDEPVLGEDVVQGGDLGDAASIPGEVRSVLAARLVHEGREEGVVYLESPRAHREFSGPEALLLRRLCEFAATALARARRQRRLEALHRTEVERHHPVGNIHGASPAMRDLRAEIAQAAPRDVTTLILGPSGAGKELVAKALHAGSPRAAGPFVAVNCAGIPEALLESELFGHARGAFSGAETARLGRFELADGGTLFLDELADLPLASQAKLLRVLEERVVEPVGGRPRPIDIRVVAATNADLEAMVAAGEFREDLWFRLAVFVLRVPPLRERAGDVPALAGHFLARACRKHRRELAGFTPAALALLARYPWPGNVRELSNTIEQACIREEGPAIDVGSLAVLARPGPTAAAPAEEGPRDLAAARARFERDFLTRALEEEAGDVKAVLARLGVSQTTLYTRCKALGIEIASFRRS